MTSFVVIPVRTMCGRCGTRTAIDAEPRQHWAEAERTPEGVVFWLLDVCPECHAPIVFTWKDAA